MLKILERKAALFLISIGVAIVFLILGWLYGQKQDSVYVIIAVLFSLAWMVYVLWYAYVYWLHFIEAQLKRYRERNNLASGVLVWLSFFLYLILVPGIPLLIMGHDAPDVIRNGYPTYLNILIAIMPAVLGLLGVQYTIAIQDKNRKEDIRLTKKPFFVMEYKVGDFTKVEDRVPHAFLLHFRIKNISENIAIPVGFGGDKTEDLSFWFDYSPLPSAGIVKAVAEIDNKAPLSGNIHIIKFYYKDVLEHYYCTRICIQLSNAVEYKTPVVCSEFLCPPETEEWLKETAFSKSSDYWKTYGTPLDSQI